MEIKNTQVQSSEKSFNVQKVKDFVGDIKSEIHKVHWTSRDELLAYTKIVVITTFLFGMAIYFVDMMIQGSLSGLSYLLSIIAG